MESHLIDLIVLMALFLVASALVVLFLCSKAMVSYARVEIDAGQKAIQMQAIIDSRVRERITTVQVDQHGNIVAKKVAQVGEQPPNPSVRTSSILDDVMENEREANRVMNPHIDWNKRDYGYQEQPVGQEEL